MRIEGRERSILGSLLAEQRMYWICYGSGILRPTEMTEEEKELSRKNLKLKEKLLPIPNRRYDPIDLGTEEINELTELVEMYKEQKTYRVGKYNPFAEEMLDYLQNINK